MATPFFPRRQPREAPIPPPPAAYSNERCHPNVPTAQCEGRRLARELGDMEYDFELDGWFLFDDMAYTRTITSNGGIDRWIKVRNAGRDTTGEAYLLDLCPFCGCELPILKDQ